MSGWQRPERGGVLSAGVDQHGEFLSLRRLLGGGLEQATPREPTSDFVDLGLLNQGSEEDGASAPAGRLELTLELGGGVVLHLVRG